MLRVRRTPASVVVLEEGIVQQLANMAALDIPVPRRVPALPDLCLLLRCDPEVAVQRRFGRPYGDMSPGTYTEFAQRHQLESEEVLQRFNIPYIEVNTRSDPASVTQIVVEALLRLSDEAT